MHLRKLSIPVPQGLAIIYKVNAIHVPFHGPLSYSRVRWAECNEYSPSRDDNCRFEAFQAHPLRSFLDSTDPFNDLCSLLSAMPLSPHKLLELRRQVHVSNLSL